MTNQPKTSIVKSQVLKGKQGVTWDEATFTWDQGSNSTWDSVGAIVTQNLSKSSVTKATIIKSTTT